MPTAKNEVKLKFGTKKKYTSATKNADTVYFITDTHQIFVGSSLVSSKCYYVTVSPVASNYGVGDVVVWKLSDSNANICVVNSSGEFDTFSISVPTDAITANTNARHSHTNKEILDAISGTPIQVVAQKLTDEQKTQARTNIGALGTVVPNPTNDNDAANKAYVDSKVSSGGVTVDPSISDTSTNPVQNKAIKAELDKKFDKAGGTISGSVYISQEFQTPVILEDGTIGFGNTDDQKGAYFCMENRSPDLPVIKFYGNDNDAAVKLAHVENPEDNYDAANKQYVDNAVAGAGMPHPIILQKDTDYGDTLPTTPVEGQLFLQNATSGLPIAQGGTGATTQSDALNNLKALPLAGGTMDAGSKITHPGNATYWYNGRDGAILRLPNGVSDRGVYHPIISSKTFNGDWTIGTYSDRIQFNYTSDKDYNNHSAASRKLFSMSSDGEFYWDGGKILLATGTLGASASSVIRANFDGNIFKNLLVMMRSISNNGNKYSSFVFPTIANTWGLFLPTYNDYFRAAITISGSGSGMECMLQMDSNESGVIGWIYATA